MHIRVGYEMAVEVTSPTAIYTYLNVHPQHSLDMVWSCPESFFGSKHTDVHGNEFNRLILPAGETVLSHDAIYENNGLPDVFDDKAEQVDPAHLSTEYLPYRMRPLSPIDLACFY